MTLSLECQTCKFEFPLFRTNTLNYLLLAFHLNGMDRRLTAPCPRCRAQVHLPGTTLATSSQPETGSASKPGPDFRAA